MIVSDILTFGYIWTNRHPRQAKMINVRFPPFLENPQEKIEKSSKLFSFDIMMYEEKMVVWKATFQSIKL